METELRDRLHRMLDEILDARSTIEGSQTANAPKNYIGSLKGLLTPQKVDELGARIIYTRAVELASEVAGERILVTVLDGTFRTPEDQRKILRHWLNLLHPLLSSNNWSSDQMTSFDVVNALAALNAGEVQPIFRANTGKARRPNRWSLAKAKLEALTWKRRLRALGRHEKEANYAITMAFGEQWDTIRKWHSHCEQILSPGYVFWALERAGSSADFYLRPPTGGLFGARRPDLEKGLREAGERYRAEVKRSAELSRRKSGRPLEK